MSSYLPIPRIRHLDQALHIFRYLKLHTKRKLIFDPGHLAINENRFQDCDQAEFLRDDSEEIPGNNPVPRANFMSTHCFVDANHSGDTETRRSQTPTIWFRRRQNSVEAYPFGSEFTEMNNTVYIAEALFCKLRMFGVPIDVPTKIFCDNGYACENTKRPESTLTKKHHIIDYHHIREAVASGTFIFLKSTHLPTWLIC